MSSGNGNDDWLALKTASWVRYAEECPLPSGIGGLWEFPQRDLGRNPSRTRILEYFEGHRTFLLHIYVDVLSSSNSVSCHIWGQGARSMFGEQLPGNFPHLLSCPNVERSLD